MHLAQPPLLSPGQQNRDGDVVEGAAALPRARAYYVAFALFLGDQAVRVLVRRAGALYVAVCAYGAGGVHDYGVGHAPVLHRGGDELEQVQLVARADKHVLGTARDALGDGDALLLYLGGECVAHPARGNGHDYAAYRRNQQYGEYRELYAKA